MGKLNSIIVLLYTFHIIHPQKQKRSVRPFCSWGEHSKGLSNQADVELDMINAMSAADIAFIMSSSQAIVNWLNAFDQSDFFIVSLMYNNKYYFPLTCFAREPRVTYILVSTWKNKISSRIVYYQEMKHWPCNDKKDCIVLSSDNITHPKVEMQLSCHLSFLLGFSPIESSFNCLLFNPLGYSSLFISLLLTFASLAQAPQFLIKLYI